MAKERHVHQARLAEIKNCSRAAIGKAIREDRLILHGDGRAGRVDLECPLTVVYLDGIKVKPSKKKPPRVKPVNAAPKSDDDYIPPPSPPKPDEGESQPDINSEKDKSLLEQHEIKKLKVVAELEKLNLNNREKRGELVKRYTVQQFMHRLHEIDNGQWKTLGLKLASSVAAELEIEDEKLVRKVCDVIEKEVLTVLKQVKREQNKFLKKLGAEKLPRKNAA